MYNPRNVTLGKSSGRTVSLRQFYVFTHFKMLPIKNSTDSDCCSDHNQVPVRDIVSPLDAVYFLICNITLV